MAKSLTLLNLFKSRLKGSTQEAGQLAEQAALEHLEQHQLTLITRNWRCRGGELDLVMQEGDTVVFVEVRYRRDDRFGGAIESVDARKRSRLILAAQKYLQQHTRWQKHPCRFDVVALKSASTMPHVEWIKNAFDA